MALGTAHGSCVSKKHDDDEEDDDDTEVLRNWQSALALGTAIIPHADMRVKRGRARASVLSFSERKERRGIMSTNDF